MEKVEAPKRRSFYRRYKGTLANRVRVDAGWNSDEVRRWKSRSRSDRPSESHPRNYTLLITPPS